DRVFVPLRVESLHRFFLMGPTVPAKRGKTQPPKSDPIAAPPYTAPPAIAMYQPAARPSKLRKNAHTAATVLTSHLGIASHPRARTRTNSNIPQSSAKGAT